VNGHQLLILPIVVPLLTLVVCAALWRQKRLQRLASLAGSLALLAAAVALLRAVFDGAVIASDVGAWRAPFGISLVADLFSAAMVVITGIMATAVSVFAFAERDGEPVNPFFHPLYHGLLLGVSGAFLTGDLFNLYVWFEVMLIASFGLLTVGGSRAQLDAGIKYVMLNLVATTLFLVAVGMLYGATGTLNMADLSRSLAQASNPGLVTTLAVLLLIAFGSKAAVFPLFFWLPASYHTASAPVAAIFAALLTKVGVYAIIRVFTLVFPGETGYVGNAIGVIAALTMVTGVLGAAAHYDVRRILSFHIISQIGYMLIGLAVATPLALAGSILYVLHHIVVKANLFLVAGAMRLAGGSFDVRRSGGLHRTAPLLAMLFLVPAMSLAGIPPLSGFWAKYVVVKSSLDAGHVALAAVALAVGLLTLYSMLKIWNEAFWKTPPEGSERSRQQWLASPATRATMLLPIAALAAITLTIGIAAEPFVDFSIRAANQLLEPGAYVEAVLGPDPIRLAPPQRLKEISP